MQIYVASKFENKEAVRAAYAVLREDGHEITHDWTVHDETPELTPEQLAAHSDADLEGVESADVLIFIPHPTAAQVRAFGTRKPMKGAWVELGYALACNVRVIVVSPEPLGCIFEYDPLVYRVDDLKSARALLAVWWGEWAL